MVSQGVDGQRHRIPHRRHDPERPPREHGSAGFPLFPPALRRPFSAATGSGRFSFGTAGTPDSRSVHPNAETSGVGVAVAQPLSPELVLVCPELRERALAQLPPLDPDALFAVDRRPPQPHVVRPRPVVQPPARQPPRPGPSRAPLPVAVVAYATEALLVGVVRGAALITAIGVAAYLLAR